MGYQRTPEGELKRECLDWLSIQKNCVTLPITIKSVNGRRTTMRRGTPDTVLCWWGRFVGVEYKSKSGQLSKEQLEVKQDVEAAGGVYLVVRSLEDLQKALFALEAT